MMEALNQQRAKARMKRAVLIFLGVFLFGQAVIGALAVFRVPLHASMGVILYMIALWPPVADFVKRENRIMTLRERSFFGLWAMLIVVAPSVAFLAAIDGGSVLAELAREFAFSWRQGRMSTVGLFMAIAIAVPAALWLAALFTATVYGKQVSRAQQKAQSAGPR
jgi:hypothetical protein